MIARKKKILVVDDDQLLSDALKQILDDEGYRVFVINDGRLLNDYLQKNKPDLILLDYCLPGRDGLTLAGNLKKNMNTAEIPVIMISASVDFNGKKKLENVDAFLAKPFLIGDLLLMIENYLPAV
ncbi:MAG: response regulator receiver protein [uncultured bacterium]|nr:MAG: response regulator receiver protein [uncultured bacterium]